MQRRRVFWSLAALGVVIAAASMTGSARFPEADNPPAAKAAPAEEGARTAPKRREARAVVGPGAAVTRTTPVPILMYHAVAPAREGAPYPHLYVAPKRFRAHMAYLARHRYEVVTLQQVWDHWHGGKPLPRKPVVVTFDDGSRDWYRNALPILRKHGWVGTMNIAVNHLNRWGIPARRVRQLVAAGWELDSHSLTHPDLRLLSRRDLRREVAASRRRLRRLFGVPVNFFCYPVGAYNDAVVAEVRKAGYLGATTTVEGLAVPTTPFALRRVRIAGSDDVAEFGKKMSDALEVAIR